MQRGVKTFVKKSGSLESASERSISPNEIIETIKENKHNLNQQKSLRRPTAVKTDNIKTGITKPKLVSKTTSKTTQSVKPSPAKPSSRLQSPRSQTNTNKNPSLIKSPRASAGESPTWKNPSVNAGLGKPAAIRPLPGRGGPKKLKKVYNPPSLFSLCKSAVSTIITPPEVDDEAKEFVKRRLFNQAVLGTIWDTLTKETKNNRISKEALLSERDELTSELNDLKSSLDSQINSLTKQHHDTVNNLTKNLLSKHHRETKSLKENYETTISDLESQLSTISVTHGNEVRYIRETHSLEIATLHRDHERQRNLLIAGHQGDLARMEGVQRALEEQNEYLDGQIREKDENIQQEVEAQVQEQVQRYSTIKAELQSLHDVIDMKNTEIRKLFSKIKDLEVKTGDIPTLEKDLASYRDHNEQLRAMIDLRTESERTLNLTQEHLNQTIKDKENENKNISLRCEELAFKLSLLEEKVPNGNTSSYFTPLHYSTPGSSPRRQFSEPPLRSVTPEFTDSPKTNIRSKSQVKLFDAKSAAAQLLP